MSDSLQPHELKNTRLPYPSLTPRICSNSCPLSLRWHPTICPAKFRFQLFLLFSLVTSQFHFFPTQTTHFWSDIHHIFCSLFINYFKSVHSYLADTLNLLQTILLHKYGTACWEILLHFFTGKELVFRLKLWIWILMLYKFLLISSAWKYVSYLYPNLASTFKFN